MTDKVNWPALLCVGVIALVLGGVLGAIAFATETEVKVNVPVEKVVTNTVEVEKVVEVNKPQKLLDQSVEDLLEYLDDEDLLVCDGDEYDQKEVVVKKVYDEFSVTFDEDDEYTVAGKVKLSYKQEDIARCLDTLEYEVFYEPDEDAEVTIL